MQEILNRLETKLSSVYNNQRHVEVAADSIIMAGVRTSTDTNQMLDALEDGTIFDTDSFITAQSGNIFDYVDSNYIDAASRFIEITVGGNGGMASVGRGEFAICFLSNFQITPSKSGRGDLNINDKYEEVKFNNGKINVVDRRGSDINQTMNQLLSTNGYTIKDFVPFRKTDSKSFTPTQIEQLNGLYYQAVTGTDIGPLTDLQLKSNFGIIAFTHLFAKSDSILIIEESGNFTRLSNIDEAKTYVINKGLGLDFELRAKQSNPPALYC